MSDPTTMPCETCKLRRKAEQKPRSLLGLIWRLHARICPGWKAYRRAVEQQAAAPDKAQA